MKTEKNILIAFLLNLGFSILELVGGLITGSMAILSDAVHDLGDAASIGACILLDKRARKQPDESHTYGYGRYSVLGGAMTTLILIFGSCAVIWSAIDRILHPVVIHYDGMFLFAVFGVGVNLCAALFTRGAHSVNQKAVSLHMLEDVLGWVLVLVGTVVMKFTDFSLIDPIMSIAVAVFILIHAIGNLKETVEIFVEKTPKGIHIDELRCHICHVDGVLDAHHIHVWSLDGQNHYGTAHIVTDGDPCRVKQMVREELKEHGIIHATLELESVNEQCQESHCHVEFAENSGHHHHHHEN